MDEFELQPPEIDKHSRPNTGPKAPPAKQPPSHLHLEEAPSTSSAPVLDGPPPSDKVDFENLPEFVWQRNMLRKVRIGAMIFGAIVLLAVIYFARLSWKKGKEALQPAMDPIPSEEHKTDDPTKSN